LISLVQEERKRYRGRFVLGCRSDTDDITGNVTDGDEWTGVTKRDLESLLPEFIGRIDQTPPQFSAIHVQGRRAYKLARRGEFVELAARPVDVFSLRLTEFHPPEFELEVECGSGTYIRSIGRDLGLRLGCGAVMNQLRRLAIGPFDVTSSTSPDDLTPDSIGKVLQPALTIVSHFAQRQLTSEEMIAIRRGQSITAGDRSTGVTLTEVPQSTDPRTALIAAEGRLMGIAEYDQAAHRLHPRIVFPEKDARW
jgi:tRNA pseudouridine55 synthase